MPQGLSKALLTQVLDAVLHYSASLDRASRAPELLLLRKRVAKRAFGLIRSGEHLSELESLRPKGKALTADDLEATLGACRILLKQQYDYLHPRGSPNPTEFESSLCKRLGLSGTMLQVRHFDIQEKLMTASTPAEFGHPDMVTWEGAELLDDLASRQRSSLELLPLLRSAIELASTNERKLQLVHVAVSLATLHHPGEPWHERALHLAADAADAAGVLRLVHSRDDSLRLQATRIVTQLHWCSFAPHLRSPTNYLPLVLSRTRLDPAVWRRIAHPLNVAVNYAGEQLRIAPTSPQVLREHASALSLKARLLLVTGDGDAIDEAEKLNREAVANLHLCDMPYGYVYPIMRGVWRGDLEDAVRHCGQALHRYQHGRDRRAEIAFGALFFHLTALASGKPTDDMMIRTLAREAASSPSIQYQYSHVFDIQSVRRLLRKRRKKPHFRAR